MAGPHRYPDGAKTPKFALKSEVCGCPRRAQVAATPPWAYIGGSETPSEESEYESSRIEAGPCSNSLTRDVIGPQPSLAQWVSISSNIRVKCWAMHGGREKTHERTRRQDRDGAGERGESRAHAPCKKKEKVRG